MFFISHFSLPVHFSCLKPGVSADKEIEDRTILPYPPVFYRVVEFHYFYPPNTACQNVMDLHSYDDKHLFQLISEGDEAAFRAVFRRYSRPLISFLIKLSKSEPQAEEWVQETFLRVWLNRSQLPQIENPRAWIYRIAANLAYTWLKRSAVEDTALRAHQRLHTEAINPVEESLSFRQLKNLIQEAIYQLPPKRRQIFELHRNQGLKASEIAEELGISVSTVKNSLLSATKSIREFVEKHGHELGAVVWLLLRR